MLALDFLAVFPQFELVDAGEFEGWRGRRRFHGDEARVPIHILQFALQALFHEPDLFLFSVLQRLNAHRGPRSSPPIPLPALLLVQPDPLGYALDFSGLQFQEEVVD